MEESEAIPIFRRGKSGKYKGGQRAGLKMIIAFFPLVVLLLLSFYFWQLKTVVVVEESEKKQFSTFCRTIGDFLEEKELQVGCHDQLVPGKEEKIMHGQIISIKRAFPVTLVVDGDSREVWTCSLTAADLLQEQGIELEGQETISPGPDTFLSFQSRQKVRTVQVSRGRQEETPSVVEGREKTSVETTFMPEDSASEKREMVSTEISSVPEDREMASMENTLSRGGRDWEFEAMLEVTATAYCPGTAEAGCPFDARGASQCTGFYNDGYTATGICAVAGDGSMANPHLIAVDPAVIPLKSLVYIEGYGFARAEDTGSAIKEKSIDILFNKHNDAWIFGRQKLKVYILSEPAE